MSRHKKGRTLKKIGAALLAVLLAALFFVLLAGFGHTAPDNPMEDKEADASRMYLTSSTLAMDKEQLEGVENANINAGEEGDAQEEEQNQETEETPPQEAEPQEGQEAPQENLQENTDTENSNSAITTPSRDSLLSLIDKHKENDANDPTNPGGEGPGDGDEGGGEKPGGNEGQKPTDGGSTALNPEASSQLFTTNLKDGIVKEPKYDLRIELTEKGKRLKFVNQMVTVNGTIRLYRNGDGLTLKEGINRVSVTVRFRDSKNKQIDAATRTYTLIYNPENRCIITVRDIDTNQYLENNGSYTIMEEKLHLEVKAYTGDTETRHTLRWNGASTQPDSDKIYRLSAMVAVNTLKVEAGSTTFNCKVNYEPGDFCLEFDSLAVSETIGKDRFGGYTRATYTSKEPDFRFIAKCSSKGKIEKIDVSSRYPAQDMKDMIGADGYIHFDLDPSQDTKIYVKFEDPEGNTQNYTWYITYKRETDPEENAKKAPVIEAQLTSETVHLNPYILPVRVFDYMGNELRPTNFKVYLNGEQLNFSGISEGWYEYSLYLTEGQNYVRIEAEDNQQYTAVKELTVTFTPEEQSATVRMTVSAERIGLGTLIDEYITVSASTTVAQIVEDRLAAYGYTTYHEGSPTDSGYFLNDIQKPGILNGWFIDDSLRELLEMQGVSLWDPASLDILGNKTFSEVSGWMVALNDYYIGQSMGTRAIRDGDTIHLKYTLNGGGDVNLDPNGGYYD